MYMKQKMTPAFLALAVALVCAPAPVAAQTCEASDLQESLYYLRSLSLDIRGHAPSYDEQMVVVNATQVSPSTIDAYLETEGFVEQMQGFVRHLLWANIAQGLSEGGYTLFYPGQTLLNTTYAYDSPAWWMPLRSQTFRGGTDLVGCRDVPATFTNGQPDTVAGPENTQQEGWVMIAPYWDLGNPIKVCAFDAQNIAVSSSGKRCDVAQEARPDPECGCGTNLNWCYSSPVDPATMLPTYNIAGDVNQSIVEQFDRFVADIVRNDKPYTDLLTSENIEINGPLSHYLRYMTGTSGGALYGGPDQGYTVPVMDVLDVGSMVAGSTGEE